MEQFIFRRDQTLPSHILRIANEWLNIQVSFSETFIQIVIILINILWSEFIYFSEILILLRFVPQRWNSLHAAAKRFLSRKEALKIFWTKYCKEFEFTEEDWIILSEFVDVLELMVRVTTQMCADKFTTLSKVIPLTQRLMSYYTGIYV